jgi:hypothetical protein
MHHYYAVCCWLHFHKLPLHHHHHHPPCHCVLCRQRELNAEIQAVDTNRKQNKQRDSKRWTIYLPR